MYNVVVSWKTCWPIQDGRHVDLSEAVECSIYVHISMETNYNKVLHMQNYYCNSLVIVLLQSNIYTSVWSIPHLSVLLTSISSVSLCHFPLLFPLCARTKQPNQAACFEFESDLSQSLCISSRQTTLVVAVFSTWDIKASRKSSDTAEVEEGKH